MISILLMILKILGILLLVVLGIILVLALLILFVPVRYRITAHRKVIEETPVVVRIKITWLFHILNAVFSYPEAAYVRVRVFCFTIFRSDKSGKKSKPEKKKATESQQEQQDMETAEEQKTQQKKQDQADTEKQKPQQEQQKQEITEKQNPQSEQKERNEEEGQEEEPAPTFSDFFKKLWAALKNIKYTIIKIYDKIKHIVKNIQYYIKIIKSETFKRAWTVCSGQVFSLLKSILPGKLKGNLLIGTGDPASTGQVLAIYGMLYPLIGNHIVITPDFEQQIVEGELFIKGRITVFKVLKTAWIVYFNKDLRRLIKLFKREAA